MKKIILLLTSFIVVALSSFSQNVGIGTTTPVFPLHITKPSGNVQVFTKTAESTAQVGYLAAADNGTSDFTRYSTAVSGTTAGLPLAGVTRLWASGGPMLMGNSDNSPIYFVTSLNERMRIGGDGKIMINTTGISAPSDYQLNVNAGIRGAAIFLENPIVSANETVSIGRGVPATRFNRTTPLHVIAASDRAIVAEGDNFEAVEATTYNTAGRGAGYFRAAGATGEKISVELDGFLKVSGNKTAFKHTTATANISGNVSYLTYDSPTADDIVMITHNYSPSNTYLNKAVGVYWTGSRWSIYTEDLSAMPQNVVFNVLVIRQ